MTTQDRNRVMAADLYCDLLVETPQPKRRWQERVPGMAMAVVASLAAAWLSDHYGAPIILMGLLIGLSLSFVSAEPKLAPGLTFASHTLLRIGIVLVGAQITFAQIGSLGLAAFVALVGIMAIVMLTGVLVARLFKQDVLFGLLAGGATAICGASAALALWSLIGEKRIDQARFTIVLVGISVASALAMSFYPPIAEFLGLNDRQAGFLIGASIHDVAQAIGGGFSFSRPAGEVATIVKLTRVTLLAPVLAIVAIVLRSRGVAAEGTKSRIQIPWFVLGFLALVGINTALPLPAPIIDASHTLSKALLLVSVTATAMKSQMAMLLTQGWRSFAPVIAATLMAFALSLGAALIL
ncbi:YeiH family protein [Sphingobium algorifonticola]|nr:putative sulfate exporter family transporter [Sphingobium algorifonticola]